MPSLYSDFVATQEERRNSTRSAIIEAAYTAFKDKGTCDVALEVIAESAGVTKGSIHYHFKNRVGLIKAVAISVFLQMEEHVPLTPLKKGKRKDGAAANYIRSLLTEQATPTGRVLFTVGDELAQVGELNDIDPYTYLCHKLQLLGIDGSVSIVAAAVTHFGRQLAYGLAPASEIDQMVASLVLGGKLSPPKT